MATNILGMTLRARSSQRSEAKAPSPENTSMPVISTDADTVALLSASMAQNSTTPVRLMSASAANMRGMLSW